MLQTTAVTCSSLRDYAQNTGAKRGNSTTTAQMTISFAAERLATDNHATFCLKKDFFRSVIFPATGTVIYG